MKCVLFKSVIYKHAGKRIIETDIFPNGFKDKQMKLIKRVLQFLILWFVAGVVGGGRGKEGDSLTQA